MAISVNDFRMAIRIDNSEAKVKFSETKEQIAKVRAEMEQLDKAGKKNSDEYKALKVQLDKLNTGFKDQRKEVGLNALSYAELRKGARQLKTQLDKAVPGTEKWVALRADFTLTKQRMKELTVQAVETRFSLSKITDGFNKYAAIGASTIAVLTGVTMTARKCVDEFVEMQEAEAQVVKYTGMAKQEVSELNDEFKQIDTRTVREDLNALAGDAGRLGITAKKDVLDFVDAADKINVALGEDLGDDAVKNIGKLAQMFGEDKKLGLRGAMLATGSAINEVAQSSSAAEAYLVGFTARVAGSANQARMAQGDIIGYASVLDQNMQQQEMAATAFQNLMMKMFQNPAKFAKLSGKSVKEFTELIKNDANEAILQFLDTLNQKGGFDQLAPMFKEMGMDGVRAAGVISTMAGKIDDIRTAQTLANGAYRDGTSIIKEFNVQNNTEKAKLEKAKKNLKDIRIELGEKLLPAMRYMVTTGKITVKGLSLIVSIFSEYKTALISATIAISGYTIAVNGSVIADKAKLFWTNKIVASLKTLYAVAKSHPWGMLIAVGASLLGYLKDVNKQLSESERLERNLKDIRRQATSVVEQESAKLNSLLKIARDENKSKKERELAIVRLNDLSPEYLGNLSLEKIHTKEATAAVNAYIDSLLILEDIKLTQQKISELNNQKNDMIKNGTQNTFLEDVEAGAANMLNGFKRSLGLITDSWADNVLNKYIYKGVEEMRAIENELTALNAHIEKSRGELIKVASENSVESNEGGGSGTDGDNKDKRPWLARLQALDNAHKEELLLLRKNSDELSRTENEYQLDALQKEMEYQAKKIAIVKHYQSTTENAKHLTELGKQESDSRVLLYDSLKKSEEVRLNLVKEYRDRRLYTVTDGEKKAQLEQSKLYEKGDLSEKDYKNRILALEVTTLYARLEVAEDYQADIAELEFQNGEVKENALKEAGDNILKIEREISEKRAGIVQSSINQVQAFNNQFTKANSLASTGEQLSALKTFYESQCELAKKNGLDTTLLTATYEEAKRKIEIQGAEDRADVVRKYSLASAEENRDLKLKALEEEHKKGLLSEEEYEIAKSRIANEYLQEKIEANLRYFDAVTSILGNASSAIQGFQDAEINKVSKSYDKKIKAAHKAGEDTTKLEEEKEEATSQIRKKYADKQFAVSVLQITATTAVAAMRAYAAMSGIPVVGPALGAIAAAAAVASGAAQIAVAKQQRDEAKGLKSGGYSEEYVQGYTRTGNPDDVAGVIPVHKNEFVTNHEGVANPHVRQFLDVFDVAQKNGTIRMINTTQILEHIKTRSGRYDGGYSYDDVTPTPSFAGSQTYELTPEQRSQVVSLLIQTNKLLEVICRKELVVDPRKVRDGIKRIEQLEKNVSRP